MSLMICLPVHLCNHVSLRVIISKLMFVIKSQSECVLFFTEPRFKLHTLSCFENAGLQSSGIRLICIKLLMFLVKALVGAGTSLFTLLCLEVILTFISCMSFVNESFSLFVDE